MATYTTPHFIGSAERWGDQAFARICKIVVDHNDGINQSVMEKRTDLLDLMTNDQLIAGDDLGLSVAYSAVYYDQPDIIKYLHNRKIDLSQTCDPMGYGTPLFYAIMMGRLQVIMILQRLGYSLQKPCENTFYQTPLHYAKIKGNADVIEFITRVVTREQRAKDLLQKNMLRRQCRRKYLAVRRKIIKIQTLFRGRQARHLVDGIRRGEIELASESEEEEEEDADEDADEEEDGSVLISKSNLSHVEEAPNEDDDSVGKSRTSLSHVEEEENEDDESVDRSKANLSHVEEEDGDDDEDSADD